jgi:hypothetical protein
MKKQQKRILLVLGIIVLAVLAWYLIAPAFTVIELEEASPLEENDNIESLGEETLEASAEDDTEESRYMSESMDSEAILLDEEEFEESAHEVAGTAQIIQDGDKVYLRFEDFETINGPDLHVYLSTGLGLDDAIDLGELKATQGSFNYDVTGIDLEKYNQVLIWCDPFGVLFSYADFS